MTFDRAAALAEADECERKLLTLYYALEVPAAFLKLLGNSLVVRCEREEDVLPLCNAVVNEYKPPAGQVLN